MLFIDGAYLQDRNGTAKFHHLPPSQEEAEKILTKIIRKVTSYLVQNGLFETHYVESARGTSPRAAPRTGREPLSSSGSH